MAIADKLRKAASLFIVLPEPEAKVRSAAEPTMVTTPTSSSDMSNEELDRRLAQMNATIHQINTGGTAPAETPVPAPVTGQTQTIDELLKKMDGPALTEVSVSSAEVPVPTDGSLPAFEAIYQTASLPSTPFSAEQMLEMIQSFPANLPLDVKRMTVNATIATMGKTIGATPESIVADASRKLAALAAYETDHTKQAETFITTSEAEIADLLAQVEEKRQAILVARQQDATVRTRCDAEADRLDDILEFFSLDIGVSKYARPSTTTPPPLPPLPPEA